MIVVILAGCSARVDLFSGANESEANEVLAALLDAGVDAKKDIVKTGTSISVSADQVARALDLLRARGLPRERFDGMGQIFRKEGLISSPLEERARYIYALSQELTNTLSQMDGVLAARVHVVLPERAGVGEAAAPSTAAVFIKHQAGYNLDAVQPQVRSLVTHAIPGLAEDRVSIALVSAQPSVLSQQPSTMLDSVAGIAVESASAGKLKWMLSILLASLVMLAAVLGYVCWRTNFLGSRAGRMGLRSDSDAQEASRI